MFEPRHTVHGFQYVRVDGHPHVLDADDATGVVVHTDLRRTGWFRCSDERINRFHEIADWSFRDNACDIPTDCPHRERSGWTGDWQLFVPSAAFIYDVAGFSTKWLRDLAAEQLPDGLLPNYVAGSEATASGRRRRPDLVRACSVRRVGATPASSCPGRCTAATATSRSSPRCGRPCCGGSTTRRAAARSKRHASRVEQRPEPAPHEEYLWDGGWHWGEWCEPATGGEPW